ncbi:MAG: hypothetical protein M3O36_16570 [Myxococcota bacterium]|nr:hypothetical protein [Myxococcota bacterium]
MHAGVLGAIALALLGAACTRPDSIGATGTNAGTDAGSSSSPATRTAASPLRFAHRVVLPPGLAPPPVVARLVVGERWGCARFASAAGAVWQCWDAPIPAGGAPDAWHLQWADGKLGLEAALDRLCELSIPEMAWQCWRRPLRGERAASALPPSWQWPNPHHAVWGWDLGPDRVVKAVLGGTFACLQNADHNIWCVGDNRYQQLGSSSSPSPDPKENMGAFVPGLSGPDRFALGMWHGCAIVTPPPNASLGKVLVRCWGRGDLGQLDRQAPDTCVVDGRSIACAKEPVNGPSLRSPDATLHAGDLFTCLGTDEGVQCWGANRDGFFGVPGSCPEAIRRAWPAAEGSVPAPRAACSDSPVWLARVGPNWGNDHFEAAPRGVCVYEQSRTRCFGAIPLPKLADIEWMTLSPGQDASACGVHEGAVVCWGEAYSRPDALDTPVPIRFDLSAPDPALAVVLSGDPSTWDPTHLLAQGLAIRPAPIPTCTHDIKPRTVRSVLAGAAGMEGRSVRIRGRLAARHDPAGQEEGGWPCIHPTTPVVIADDAENALPLKEFCCVGNSLEASCNVPAYGQTVVASGRVEGNGRYGPRSGRTWMLADVQLCAEEGGDRKDAH